MDAGAAAARHIFRPASPAAFARALAAARFGEIRRIGKHLLVTLERDGAPLGLLAHLGMTGKWLRREQGDAPPRFSRARAMSRPSRVAGSRAITRTSASCCSARVTSR